MKILAIDTSTSTAAIAIIDNDILLSEIILNDGHTHSRKLAAMIDTMFNNLSLEANDIDIYAVSVGPGSFTGLRIGVVTAKTMALVTGKQTIGVSTLDALAYNAANPSSLVCPMIDARNNNVYTAIYKSYSSNKLPQVLTEYMAVPISELAVLITEQIKSIKSDKPDIKVIFNGDASNQHREFLVNTIGEEFCEFSGTGSSGARASSVALIAFDKYKNGKCISPDQLVPFYLKKSSAEQQKEKLIKNNKLG